MFVPWQLKLLNFYGVHFYSKHFEHIFDSLTPFSRPGGQIPQSGINKIDVGIFYDVMMRVQGLRRKFYDVISDRRIWPPGRENGVRKSKMCSKCFER